MDEAVKNFIANAMKLPRPDRTVLCEYLSAMTEDFDMETAEYDCYRAAIDIFKVSQDPTKPLGYDFSDIDDKINFIDNISEALEELELDSIDCLVEASKDENGAFDMEVCDYLAAFLTSCQKDYEIEEVAKMIKHFLPYDENDSNNVVLGLLNLYNFYYNSAMNTESTIDLFENCFDTTPETNEKTYNPKRFEALLSLTCLLDNMIFKDYQGQLIEEDALNFMDNGIKRLIREYFEICTDKKTGVFNDEILSVGDYLDEVELPKLL